MITEERLRQTFSEGGAQEIYQEVKASGDFLGFARQHNRGTVLLLSCCDNERTVPVYVPKS